MKVWLAVVVVVWLVVVKMSVMKVFLPLLVAVGGSGCRCGGGEDNGDDVNSC